MISYALEYPSAWSATVADAVRSWPSVFAVAPVDARDEVARSWAGADGGMAGERTLVAAASGASGAASPTAGHGAHIRAWFGSELHPALAASVATGSVSAAGPVSAPSSVAWGVVGRRPMAVPRMSAWLRRIALPIATGEDLAVVQSWDVGEVTRHTALPSGSGASRAARAAVREVVSGRGTPDRVDDVMLAASELAANAVQHGGGGPIELLVHCADKSVAVELTDTRTDALPSVQRMPVTSISGRGMSIVDTLADHWGVTVRPGAKSVWCEFRI